MNSMRVVVAPVPRGPGWRALARRSDDTVIEVFGVPGAWLGAVWSHGYLLGRSPGTARTARAALENAGQLVCEPPDPTPSCAVQTLPSGVRRVLRHAPQASRDRQVAACDLALAFGVDPPDFGRLAWHGQTMALRMARDPVSARSRGQSLARGLAGADLSGHEAMEMLMAANAAGIVAIPTDAPTPPGEIESSRSMSRASAVAAMMARMMTLGGTIVEPVQPWLTLDQVADLLAVPRSVVEELIATRRLPCVELPVHDLSLRVRVLPSHLDVLARNLQEALPCPGVLSQTSGPARAWSGAPDPSSGMSSGMTRTPGGCAAGRPAPETAPQLKRPGRGSPRTVEQKPKRRSPRLIRGPA
jgi:hypothetical protein